MKITYAQYSHIGSRDRNEDSVAALSDGTTGLFLVADGLGGHGLGDYASQLTVRTAAEMYQVDPAGFTLSNAFQLAQERLLREQQERGIKGEMKTTFVALDIRMGKANTGVAAWAHIGDSRLYCFKKRKLMTRTLDHSVPQMLVAMGDIREKDIRGHVDRNRLLRVMGSPWESRSFTLADPQKILKPLQFLLCTDGFWENIVEKDMQDSLKNAATVEEWLQKMVEIVHRNGQGAHMDNNSAVAVWVEK